MLVGGSRLGESTESHLEANVIAFPIPKNMEHFQFIRQCKHGRMIVVALGKGGVHIIDINLSFYIQVPTIPCPYPPTDPDSLKKKTFFFLIFCVKLFATF